MRLTYLQRQGTFQVSHHSHHLNLVVVVRIIGVIRGIVPPSASSSRFMAILFWKPGTGMGHWWLVLAGMQRIVDRTLEALVLIVIRISLSEVSIVMYGRNNFMLTSPSCF